MSTPTGDKENEPSVAPSEDTVAQKVKSKTASFGALFEQVRRTEAPEVSAQKSRLRRVKTPVDVSDATALLTGALESLPLEQREKLKAEIEASPIYQQRELETVADAQKRFAELEKRISAKAQAFSERPTPEALTKIKLRKVLPQEQHIAEGLVPEERVPLPPGEASQSIRPKRVILW